MLNTSLKPVTRWTAAVLVIALPATACNADEETAKTTVNRVVGDWKAEAGQTLTLSADRTFISFGLNSGNLADTGCPGGRAEGSWAFFADQGDGLYGTSAKAESGSEIGFSFSSGETCRMTLTVIDDGKALCATDDPDVPCGLDVRFTQPE